MIWMHHYVMKKSKCIYIYIYIKIHSQRAPATHLQWYIVFFKDECFHSNDIYIYANDCNGLFVCLPPDCKAFSHHLAILASERLLHTARSGAVAV